MKKIVALFTLLAVLTACGGGGRPSEDDIAKALKDKDNVLGSTFTATAGEAGDKAIDCIAKVLHDSKVSDDLLQAIVDNDEKYKGDSDDQKALTDAIGDMTKCVTP